MAFNEAQKRAIRHFKGPAMVLAGPGSGKTTVITHRVKALIEERAWILALFWSSPSRRRQPRR